jgi:hypothetical protein
MEGAIDSDGCCHFCGALIDPTRAPYSKEAVSAERERLRTAYLASLHGVDDIASRAVLALLSEDSK